MITEPILLTFQLAAITTLIAFLIGVPLAYWLAYTKFTLKPVVETIVSMPLVLPPSVIGFYLLITLGPSSTLGKLISAVFDVQLIFSFEGLVVASVIYSLAFMVHPIQAGFQGLPVSLREAAWTLGMSNMTTLWKVLLPNIKASLLTGIVLCFAHTIGEFGLVLMIGGNIPGETKVASIAIYDEVESLHYDVANTYSLILFVISFCILLTVYLVNKRFVKTI